MSRSTCLLQSQLSTGPCGVCIFAFSSLLALPRLGYCLISLVLCLLYYMPLNYTFFTGMYCSKSIYGLVHQGYECRGMCAALQGIMMLILAQPVSIDVTRSA